MPRQARKKSESGKVLENVIVKRHRTVPCPIYAGGSPVLGLYRRRMDEADIFVWGAYSRTYRGWEQ